MAKNIPGWQRIPKAVDPIKHARRWYINTETGQQISRTAYQTLQAGGVTPAERAKIRRNSGVRPKNSAYTNLVQAYKKKQAEILGVSPRKIRVRGNSESALKFKAGRKALADLSALDLADKSPSGKLAQILVKMGLRKPEWQFPVGESPT